MREEASRLVLDVGHEVGNLLAAVRLETHLLDEAAGVRVAGLSTRAGALLSLLRPLLEAAPDAPGSLDPLDLLGEVRDEFDDPRLQVALRGAVDLPPVRVEADVLRGLLLAEVGAALEHLPEGARLRVAAEREDGGVGFVVQGPPGSSPAPGAVRPTGRSLARVLAAALLPPRGGRVSAADDAAGARVVFHLPARA